MWYFSWILGVLLACSLGIINVLRLEAQEAFDKENQTLDPLTKLLAHESVIDRLHEKVENSKRNEMPFSLLYLSLTDFKNKHQLAEHELDTTLLKITDSIKNEIRTNLDIASKIGDEDFLLAIPGLSSEKAKLMAHRIKKNIFVAIRTPRGVPIDIAVGVAEYSHLTDMKQTLADTDEVEALLNIARMDCFKSNLNTKEIESTELL
jgi:cyd operon protein YbgT